MATITAADMISYDERTDVREVIDTVDDETCELLTAELEAGEAELLPGKLLGWGSREATLRDSGGNYYHVAIEF